MTDRNEHTSPEILIIAAKVMRGEDMAKEDLKRLAASALTQARDKEPLPAKGKPQPQVIYQPVPWSTAMSSAIVGQPYPVWDQASQGIALARRTSQGTWEPILTDDTSPIKPTHFYPYPKPPGAV